MTARDLEPLLAVAAKLVRDVGTLITGAGRAGKPLATFAMDGTVRFASPADRAAFAEELATVVTALVGKYHDEGGRAHRLVVAVHPDVPTPEEFRALIANEIRDWKSIAQKANVKAAE